jgi:hypothetical protein
MRLDGQTTNSLLDLIPTDWFQAMTMISLR